MLLISNTTSEHQRIHCGTCFQYDVRKNTHNVATTNDGETRAGKNLGF